MRSIIVERFAICMVCLTVLLCTISCSDKPQDYPNVYPCTVTVVKEGTPIDRCELTLIPSSGASSLAIGAVTNGQGVASFQTALGGYARPGVPDGTWKVVVKKAQVAEETKTAEEQAAMTKSQRDQYRHAQKVKAKALPTIVPYILGSPATTPIELTVAGQKTELTIDVAKYKDTAEIIRKSTIVAPVE